MARKKNPNNKKKKSSAANATTSSSSNAATSGSNTKAAKVSARDQRHAGLEEKRKGDKAARADDGSETEFEQDPKPKTRKPKRKTIMEDHDDHVAQQDSDDDLEEEVEDGNTTVKEREDLLKKRNAELIKMVETMKKKKSKKEDEEFCDNWYMKHKSKCSDLLSWLQISDAWLPIHILLVANPWALPFLFLLPCQGI